MPLPDDRWKALDALFEAALDLPPAEAEAFLRARSPDDPDLVAEVLDLLAASDAAEALLGDSVTTFAGPLLQDWARSGPDARGEAADELLPPPARVGPYRVLRPVGRGGMGMVYLAERADGAFTKRVALKLVRRGLDTDDILRRFRLERQLLARLDHPAIARLLDGGVSEDGRPYMVMEYVEGERLDRYCDAQRLPVEERLRLFTDVGRAVHVAHQNLIVHRDLKPSNILVTADGTPKLLDFGIAKLLEDDEEALTRTGMRVLTPEYASPEQLRGEAVTTASDVYSLGVVLYELLTGARPYAAVTTTRTPGALLDAITRHDPERPSTAVSRGTSGDTPGDTASARATTAERLQRRLRGDLDTIVLKALQPEPQRRYASAEAFVDDIKRHLAGLPVEARPDTVGYRAAAFLRRHRGAAVGTAVTLLLLLALSVLYGVQLTRERDRAYAEAQKAEATARFLRSLFRASNPAVARGDTLTAYDMLADGAARVQEELTGQPAVQASLLGTLSDSYRDLGRPEAAAPLAERAVALLRAAPAAPDSALSLALHRLALIRMDRARYADAEALHREALTLRRAAFGDTSRYVTQSMDGLARVLMEQGAYADAESFYRAALDRYGGHVGSAHPYVATAVNNLGWVRYVQGALAEADSLLTLGLQLAHVHFEAPHPQLARSEHNLAKVRLDQGALAVADSLFRRSLEARRQLYGDEHPEVALSLEGLAWCAFRRGDLARAEALQREALALHERTSGPVHLRTAWALNDLAVIRYQAGAVGEAERLFRRALQIRRARLPEGHLHIERTVTNLAALLARREACEAALPLLTESLALRTAHSRAHDAGVLALQDLLGACLIQQGRYAEAERTLTAAHASAGPVPALKQRLHTRLQALYEVWEAPD